MIILKNKFSYLKDKKYFYIFLNFFIKKKINKLVKRLSITFSTKKI